jgi:RND family efflux transporter MFP subunit
MGVKETPAVTIESAPIAAPNPAAFAPVSAILPASRRFNLNRRSRAQISSALPVLNRVGLFLGLAGIALSSAGCDSSASSASDPRLQAPLVRIAEVEPAGQSEHGFTGLVTARVQSNLTFRVAGKVSERLVDAGQTVSRGQPLMRLDRTDYEHAIAAQRGNVTAAKARLTQAAADEARNKSLLASGAVSKSAYDQAKAAADSARALFEAAEAQLQVAENEGRYTTLAADAEGVIMETLAEPGQFVAAGQVVMRLAQAGPREAAVYLPETLRPAIGSTAEASLYGVDGRFRSQLRQLSDSADPLTRTFEARYTLDGAAAAAPLGATVTIRLASQANQPEVQAPLGAVLDDGEKAGVWVLDRATSTVRFRPVKLLRMTSETAVMSGLAAGEPVVSLGAHLLKEGARVRTASESGDKE